MVQNGTRKRSKANSRQHTSRRFVLVYIVSVDSGYAQQETKGSPKDILVIVNNSSSVNNITMEELADLFLKRRRTFRNGNKAIPINAKDSALRNDFRKKVLKKSKAEEKEYWQNHRIRTLEEPPVTFANTMKAVYKLRQGIGYVYRSDMVGKVAKVVLVIPADR